MSLESENAQNLKIYYQNVQGLRTPHKQQQLQQALKNSETINLIIFVETNLDRNINTADLFDPNEFIVERKDRQEIAVRGHGGGLLIAHRKASTIKSIKVCESLSSGVEVKKEVEELWLTISMTNGENIFVCVAYLRPQCRKEYFVKFFKKLRANMETHKRDKFLIVGDFNFDDYRKFKAKVITNKRKGTKLDVMDKCTQGLRQINRIHNKDDNILDMIFTNIKGSVELSTHQLVKAQDKHPSLVVNLNIQKTEDKIDRNVKLEEELKSLRKCFEHFKISHDLEIRELRKEVGILRHALEEEEIL